MTFDVRESSRHSGQPVTLYLVLGANNGPGEPPLGPWGFCDGEAPITRTHVIGGTSVVIVYQPWPIKKGDISSDGTLDKSDINVTAALGTPIDDLFLAYPPSQVVNLTIFEGHVGDEPNDYPCVWMGRIVSASYITNEIELNCVPVSTAIRRPGLRRPYSIGCPHVLYGPHCQASRPAATVARGVADVDRNVVSLSAGLGTNRALYVGGLAQWTNPATSLKELRTIVAVDATGFIVTLRGTARGVSAGTTISLSRGCNRLMSGCNTHSNIQNYGGQPFIPLENPLSPKNQFY